MKQKDSPTFSPKRLKESFRNAFRGIIGGVKYECNLKIHFIAMICVLIAGILLNVSPLEWAILLLCIALVFSLELVNSAIEVLADQISEEYSEWIKRAKDYSAGAVLFSAIAAAVIGFIIFLPRIVALFYN